MLVDVRRVALAVVAWVVVVTVGSTLTWTVISRTGDGVLDGDLEVGSPVVGRTLGPTVDGRRLDRTPRSSSPGQRPPGRAEPGDDEAGDDPGPGTPGTSEPAAGGPTAQAPAEERTWTGRAGGVTVSCRDSAASLVRAYPSADGYVVEVGNQGPEQVEVQFEGRGGEEGAETHVVATCEGGVPQFAVAADDE